jgi:hypothetical protein
MRLPLKRAQEPLSIAYVVHCTALLVFASNMAFTARRQQAIVGLFVQI